MANGEPLLEVITSSVADALAAQQGGAGRLEVIRELACGGLTPPLELVKQILAAVSIPVRVMLRQSDGYEITSDGEKETLCNAARQFSTLGIDGVVLGFVRSGLIDVRLTQEILGSAPSLKATFHHAFEEVDPVIAIRQIKKINQVDRILTQGGAGPWSTKTENLERFQKLADPEIQLIAGGGLDLWKIADLRSRTRIREFHVGRAARVNGAVDGQVTAEQVRALASAANMSRSPG
jgi:copper homeostasis protein